MQHIKLNRFLAAWVVLLLTGCGSAALRGIEVTRFYIDDSLSDQLINLEQTQSEQSKSLEFESYASIVGAKLEAVGFKVKPGKDKDLVASLNFNRGLRTKAAKSSPFSVGVGGGSYGSNVGVSGGVSIPVGGSPGGEVYVTELQIQFIRRSTNSIVWEGTARKETETAPADPSGVMQKLATALLADFPGESGRTVVDDADTG